VVLPQSLLLLVVELLNVEDPLVDQLLLPEEGVEEEEEEEEPPTVADVEGAVVDVEAAEERT
jgi:hypothetical protein